MTTALLQSMIQEIDGRAHRLARLDSYYRGESPLSYLSPEAREALGDRFGRLSSNFCRLTITSISERLRIAGFTRDGQHDPALWSDWLLSDMDQMSSVAHREALTLGSCYVIVWADEQGRPSISVESAHQVAVVRDPGTRQITAACKRWNTAEGSEAVLYTAETITRYRSTSHNATAGSQFRTVETLDNPLGVPPVVEVKNADRLLEPGVSELRDLLGLQDAANKVLADLMIGSEFYARPRRWATGMELQEDEDGEVENPYPESNRMMIAEPADARFGQLPAADLSSYQTALSSLISQIQAVSSLPSHYLGVVSAQPPSADGLRAAEASLTARCEARQATFGRAWEQVLNLAHAVRTGTDPQAANVGVIWADPATRSAAQEADAVVKLYAAGLIPATTALERLGYSEDEIIRIRADRRTEAMDRAGTEIGQVL